MTNHKLNFFSFENEIKNWEMALYSWSLKTYSLKLYEFFYVFEFHEKLGSNILNCGKVFSYTKNSFGM